jgi:galactonate dehydratase
MNRRTFLKSTAAASAVALLRPTNAFAALPQAKITKINFYETPGNVMPLQIPLLQSSMVVTIETDANITGVGEGGTVDSLTPCAGRLIGKNPFEITRLWQDMYRAFHYPPGRERLHAMGALDLALWDLKGKALGVPVYELLGGAVRNHLECYTTGGGGGGSSLRERAASAMENGWRLFRFDAASVRGGSTYDARERVRQMAADCKEARAGVGPDGNFMVDFHQRYNLTDAARGCRMIEEYEPFAVEDPVETDSFNQDIPKLRKMTILPLSAGEELGARWDFLSLVENHDLDFIRVSLPNTGGITELIRICSLCETHDVGIMPHFTGPIATAAQVHALAPFPQSVVFEYNYGTRSLPYLNEFITFKEGKVFTNDRPGLGVTVNLERLRPVGTIDRAISRPTYYRPDGSQFTW